MQNLTADAQLLKAWEGSGMTLEEVIRRTGLKLTKSSLSRKLRGQQVLNTDEVQLLADLFGKTVKIGRRRKAA